MSAPDLISQYTDSPGSIRRRLTGLEHRLQSLFLPGYRRDGADSASFVLETEAQQLALDLISKLVGPNQIIATNTEGEITTVTVPTHGWIGRDTGNLSAGSIPLHSFVFRTADANVGVTDTVKGQTLPPGGQMMRTRGGDGLLTSDLLIGLGPADLQGETMAGKILTLNGGSTDLSWDGPYLYSVPPGATTGTRTVNLPPVDAFRPGVQWLFAAPGGQLSGSSSAPSLGFVPGAGQRIDNASSTVYGLSGRTLIVLTAVGIHGGNEHFVVNQHTPG